MHTEKIWSRKEIYFRVTVIFVNILTLFEPGFPYVKLEKWNLICHFETRNPDKERIFKCYFIMNMAKTVVILKKMSFCQFEMSSKTSLSVVIGAKKSRVVELIRLKPLQETLFIPKKTMPEEGHWSFN